MGASWSYHDTAHGLTQLEAFEVEGCGYQAFLWEAKARSILVVAVYLKTNESIQGATNAQILARILALLDASTRQFILVGDWNNHPEPPGAIPRDSPQFQIPLANPGP